MQQRYLAGLFQIAATPVVVCLCNTLRIVFINPSARWLLNLNKTDDASQESVSLREIELFKELPEFPSILRLLESTGNVDCQCEVNHETAVNRIIAHKGTIDGQAVYVMFLHPSHGGDNLPARDLEKYFTNILHASSYASDTESAITMILELAGTYLEALRGFVYEENSIGLLSHSYDWWGPNVESLDVCLPHVAKEHCHYDALITSNGIRLHKDMVSSEGKRCLFLASHSIVSSLVPLVHLDLAHGFLGFEHLDIFHCQYDHMRFVKQVADVVASLITRRNREREAARSSEIIKTVTDNLEDLLYVSDPATHEVKFISKSFARELDEPVGNLVGKRCWQVLHRNNTAPCGYCPIPKLLERSAEGDNRCYVWEMRSSINGKWYLVKNSLVKWLEGEMVHLCTYVDITYRKQYEEQLKRFAATDALTEVYNRKWGYGKLKELFESEPDRRSQRTLCFIDMDGLKKANDVYGHAAGDEMISSLLQTLYSCIRKDDFIVRWGGDEFIIFLACGKNTAAKVVEKIHFAISHFNAASDRACPLSFSHGLAGFDEFGDLDALIAAADALMYQNKTAKTAASEKTARHPFLEGGAGGTAILSPKDDDAAGKAP